MKTNLSCFGPMLAAFVAGIFLAVTASAAPPVATAQLDRADVALGDSAQLTITVSGSGNDAVSPPTVPGLEFVAAGQSSQYQSINGVASSTTSVIYQVIPHRAGTFTIPALSRGSRALVLHVRPANGRAGAAAGNNSSASSLPPPATSGLSSHQFRNSVVTKPTQHLAADVIIARGKVLKMKPTFCVRQHGFNPTWHGRQRTRGLSLREGSNPEPAQFRILFPRFHGKLTLTGINLT